MYRIIKTGSYVPNNRITNHFLSTYLDTSDEWITQRTGISQRAHSNLDSISEIAFKSVESMKLTQVDIDNVDLIIVSSMSNTLKSTPGISNLIQKKFNFKTNIQCFDINVACSGFVYAIDIASTYVESNIAKNVLVICAEKMSDIVDPNDRNTVILFGDAASSVLISNDNINHRHYRYFYTSGNSDEISCEKVLHMNGQNVFKFATSSIGTCLDLINTEYNLENIDYFLFHQANQRIINNVVKKYDLDANKVICNIENIGNTSSASIGILLDSLYPNLKKGDKIVMIGFGAGLTYGCLVYEH